MQLIRTMIVMLFSLAVMTAALAAAEPALKPVQAETEGAATMTLAAALEATLDEDPATRAMGLARLEAVTEADRTALELAAKSGEVAIRAAAEGLLKKLDRGVIALRVTFADGTPAVGVSFEVKLGTMSAEDDRQQGTKEICEAPANANRIIANAPGHSEEILSTTLQTDAAGMLKVGAYPDGRYLLSVVSTGGVPPQVLERRVNLKSKAEPIGWEIQRGIAVRMQVVDADGKPLQGTLMGVLPYRGFVDAFQKLPAAMAQHSLRSLQIQVSDAEGKAGWTCLLPVPAVGVALPGYHVMVATPPKLKDGDTWEVQVKLTAAEGENDPDNQTLEQCLAQLEAKYKAQGVLRNQNGEVVKARALNPDPSVPVDKAEADAVAEKREILCPPATAVAAKRDTP